MMTQQRLLDIIAISAAEDLDAATSRELIQEVLRLRTMLTAPEKLRDIVKLLNDSIRLLEEKPRIE